MSVKALTWAFEQDLKPTPKIILLALADYANDHGECWPGINSLCEKSGITRSTLKRNLQILEDDGVIVRRERKRNNGSQTSNRYFLNLGGVQNGLPPGPQVDPPEPSLKYIDKGAKKSKTKIPNDFAPSPETVAFCIKNRPDVNLEHFTLMFIENCKAHDRRYANFQSAYKNWIINQRRNDNVRIFSKPKKPTSDEIFDAVTKAVELSKAVGTVSF